MSADVNYLAEMTTNYIVVKRKKPNSKRFFTITNLYTHNPTAIIELTVTKPGRTHQRG